MTELEALKQEIKYLIDDWRLETILDKLESAYTLGQQHPVLSEAQLEQRRAAANKPPRPGSRRRGRPSKNETQVEMKP